MTKLLSSKLLLCIALLVSGYACKAPPTGSSLGLPAGEEQIASPEVKNIILLIGDGMGLSQITAGMYMNGNRTALEGFPIVGLQKSHSADNLITDSAAGATAFACGIKTKNGAVATDPAGVPHQTILEEAMLQGKATGLLVTSTIVHATPACFAAHHTTRNAYEDIALDMSDSDVDLLIGGGKKFFAERTDKRNLLTEMRSRGYVVDDYTGKEIKEIKFPSKGKFFYLTADEDPSTFADGRHYLIPAFEKSLDFLLKTSEGNGFFFMVESSQIDWGGHSNDASYVIQEFLEFDLLIDQALAFAKVNKNTLVIVTGDHETGGMAINPGSMEDNLKVAFTTGSHTAVMIPVFAIGPGAELFGGTYDNTAIYHKMRQAYGFE